MIPLEQFAFLLATAPPTATVPPPPTQAPPVSPVIRRTGGVPGVLRIDWTAGDADAFTRIYVGSDSAFFPYVTLNPGVVVWQSDIAADQSYSVDLTHLKDGIESVAVNATWAGA